MNDAVSDEILYAFVDGELHLAEREALLARIQNDPDLARRVCAARALRDMMKLAYTAPPALPESPLRPHDVAARCALGCLVLGIGLLAGWSLRGLESTSVVAQSAGAPQAGLNRVSLAVQPDPNRVILHLDSGDPARMQGTLDEVDRLLAEADTQGRIMQIEVVVHSHGLALLREDMSPYTGRIVHMQKRRANLQWVACSQTIARFAGEGQAVRLLPGVNPVPSAVGEIVSRLQQGWTYIRV